MRFVKSEHLPTHPSIHPLIHSPTYLSIYLFTHPPTNPPIYPPIHMHLSIHLPIHTPTHPSLHPSMPQLICAPTHPFIYPIIHLLFQLLEASDVLGFWGPIIPISTWLLLWVCISSVCLEITVTTFRVILIQNGLIWRSVVTHSLGKDPICKWCPSHVLWKICTYCVWVWTIHEIYLYI